MFLVMLEFNNGAENLNVEYNLHNTGYGKVK